MNKLSRCRICYIMVKNVRMYNILNSNLHEIYEKLTDLTFKTTDSRPLQICYICHAKLNNCELLREKCITSDRLFTHMLNNKDVELPLPPHNTLGRLERVVQWSSAPQVYTISDDESDDVTEVPIKIEENDNIDQVIDHAAQPDDNIDVIILDDVEIESNSNLDNFEANLDRSNVIETDLSLNTSEVNEVRQNITETESNPALGTFEVSEIRRNITEQTESHPRFDEVNACNQNITETERNLSLDINEVVGNRNVLEESNSTLVTSEVNAIRQNIVEAESNSTLDTFEVNSDALNTVETESIETSNTFEVNACNLNTSYIETHLNLRTSDVELKKQTNAETESHTTSNSSGEKAGNLNTVDEESQTDISEINMDTQNVVEIDTDLPVDKSKVNVMKQNDIHKNTTLDTCHMDMNSQIFKEIATRNLNNKKSNKKSNINLEELNERDDNLEDVGTMERVTNAIDGNMDFDNPTTKLKDNVCSKTVKVVLHRMNMDKTDVMNKAERDPIQDHSYSKVTSSSLDSGYPSVSSVSSAIEEITTNNGTVPNLEILNSDAVLETVKSSAMEEIVIEIPKKIEEKKNIEIKKVKRSYIKHELTIDKKVISRPSKKRFKQHINDLLKEFSVNSFEKPFKCAICAKVFLRKDTFVNHIRTHTGEKPYRCRICSKGFSRTDVLNSHIRIHTGERPYKCDVCESSFIQKCDLARHNRLHNGEKPFKCDICGRCFSEKGNLTKHVRVHTGENPYKCWKCGRRFNQKSTLNRHTRIHTGVKY